MIQIGSFHLNSKVVQSPMTHCTDLAFRLISREMGMSFAFLEMISADALVYRNKKTWNYLKRDSQDEPLGIQLVGSRPERMGEAAAIVDEMGFSIIDLNFGCPVPKIVKTGSGAALLCDPDRAKKIMESVVKYTKKTPATIKIRKGFSDHSGDEAVRIAKMAGDSGICAITVHGRTRVQYYEGTADWNIIARVKKAVSIPVLGNGDVFSGEAARQLVEQTGCDGVMIGRGSLGNPWIFRNIENALSGSSESFRPNFQERKRTALRHFDLEIQTEGEKIGLPKCRRIVAWYFKGFPGVSEFRDKINRCQTRLEMKQLIEDYDVACTESSSSRE